jgi:NAD(P)-dependent dehydrogenase (short-subunit alcohol dehydrogenase family)
MPFDHRRMKVVAITGGGQGIGRAIAFAFARAGYAVSLCDPDAKAGDEARARAEQLGARALFVRGDVSRAKDVRDWVSRTARELGTIDVLINNAGIMDGGPFLKLPEKTFDRVIAVNLKSVFLCSQTVARHMAKAKSEGAIVNIASTRALMSEPDTESYSASKGGIVALTHAMAISLAPYRIRVNCISPGWIETSDWQYSVRARKPHHSKEDREQHPVGRVGTPDDVAELSLFLCEKAGFVTGQNFVIDGGMTVKMIYD